MDFHFNICISLKYGKGNLTSYLSHILIKLISFFFKQVLQIFEISLNLSFALYESLTILFFIFR